MGYDMRQVDGRFWIDADKKPAALAAIKKLNRHGKDKRYLEDALGAWGYSAEMDEPGNITELHFTMEYLRDEVDMFQAIAPFVRNGSFLHMAGEEGEQWRWVFRDGKMTEVAPTVTWPE